MRLHRAIATLALVLAASWSAATIPAFAAKAKSPHPSPAPAAAAKPIPTVDVNNATERELEVLPGVGAATAKKIVAHRPYAAAADLSKAGLSKKTIDGIAPHMTFGAAAAPAAAAPKPKATHAKAAAAAAPAVAPPPTLPPPPAAQASKPAPAASAVQPAPPAGSGMVWVNLDSKVYHREGDHWYGKTKNGKYMTEADAIKAGYRESKSGSEKK